MMNGTGISRLLIKIVAGLCLASALRPSSAPAAGETNRMNVSQIKPHNGRPTLFVDGQPIPMAGYCPKGWVKSHFMRETPRFYPHHMTYYQIMPPSTAADMFGTQFWVGDQVSSAPLMNLKTNNPTQFADIDEAAMEILTHDSNACLVVRFYPAEPLSWKKLHPDEYALTDDGTRAGAPSMASDIYWDKVAGFGAAVISYCESRPWANHVVGYVNLYFSEGVDPSVIEGWLYDHHPKMVARWRDFLKQKYGAEDRLSAAYGKTNLTFASMEVPCDKLRGKTPEVSNLPFWQAGADNQELRDYLELRRMLFHERFRQVAGAMRGATDHQRFFVFDAFKQTMQGWNCGDFFSAKESRRLAGPDLVSASGSFGVAGLCDLPGFDGLLTPHDYQARGIGGIFEPEGIVDSMILRGKLFLCEMDQRTYVDKFPSYGEARDLREYEAISWRNLATSLTRGFQYYWMDLCSDWYAPAEIQKVIGQQVDVIKQSINWTHETVPGIAVIIDDAAALETCGADRYSNEAIMWEQKMGLARCGVPVRYYLLEDLALPQFPKHRLFYFPNLFKVDDQRLALLKEKVFRDGNVVVWGPGSGISDGHRIGPESAERLTGFQFRYLPLNYSHRALVSNFEHPVTRGLPADCILGGTVSYGPLLFPTNGVELAVAWTKGGEVRSGLSILEFGKGAAGRQESGAGRGGGDYASVFAHAVPLPADLWRNLARYAGAHVYCDENDVLMADAMIVALHSVKSGPKTIRLPGRYRVYDVVTGVQIARMTDTIAFSINAPETRVFRLEK